MIHMIGGVFLCFVLLNPEAFGSGLIIGVLLGYVLHKAGVV